MTQEHANRVTARADLQAAPGETLAPNRELPRGFWRRLMGRVGSWFEVPYGYEDDSGFHYGAEPIPEWAKKRNTAALPVLTDCDSSVIRYSHPTLPEAVATANKVVVPSDSVPPPLEPRLI